MIDTFLIPVKKGSLTALTILCPIFSTGCGKDDSAETDKKSTKGAPALPTQTRLAIAINTTIKSAPVIITQQAGFFTANGLDDELMKRAKQINPDLKCIVITGHGDIENSIEAMKAGAVNYFPKPIIVEELAITLDQCMEHLRFARDFQASEEKYRNLFSTVNDAIMIFDAQTRQFVDVNDAALDLYGYSREEFHRMHQKDILAEPEASEESTRKHFDGQLNVMPALYHRKK